MNYNEVFKDGKKFYIPKFDSKHIDSFPFPCKKCGGIHQDVVGDVILVELLGDDPLECWYEFHFGCGDCGNDRVISFSINRRRLISSVLVDDTLDWQRFDGTIRFLSREYLYQQYHLRKKRRYGQIILMVMNFDWCKCEKLKRDKCKDCISCSIKNGGGQIK
ncbi:MAG: hypothetical protein GWN01_03800 [Nitrosopumilaceae archaeon]|nr:hypothetical protein [Nitrosopumilaceae archaeon]NIU86464.1 hypothetical protein [Nitrosopumilaceae archaeon]NIV65230.1 hypothetical protein [Nitrosopumilaceae archaeon]NIX60682.1 hypothetical protein [Nitrosopumilaceae archaeon]